MRVTTILCCSPLTHHALGGRSLQRAAFSVNSRRAVTMGATSGNNCIGDGMPASLRGSRVLRTEGPVNGAWVASASGETFPVTNPATGELLACVPRAGAADTRAAADAAAAAFPSWAATPVQARSDILRRWYDLIHEHAEELATIVTLECGKPLAEARGETDIGARNVRWCSEEATRIHGDVIPSPAGDRRLLSMRQPIGVVGAITPWNFPLAMITRKVAPALAAGCTVVLKPAEETPLTAFALAGLAEDAGLPAGVLNVVAGDKEAIGAEMLASRVIRKIGFTGSTAVGKKLMAGAADTVKKITLELGGNAPFIVFDDADLPAAAAAVVGSAFRNSGQTCICAARVLVQRPVYEEFSALVAEAVRGLRTGNGLAAGVTQGPLISEAAVARVEAHVADAVGKGAEVLTGGVRCSAGPQFFQPTVLKGASEDMVVYQEETFGPVAPIFPFDTDAEGVRMANDTEYGLAAYFFTSSTRRAWEVAEALEYGMVGVNEVNITGEQIPFGGWKQSGLGREGGRHTLEEFLETKYVCMGLK